MDYGSEAHRIVLDGLERIPGFKRATNDNINIICPFHIGDSVPSCGVYIVPDGKVPVGYYYCFGCGAKGHWNDLAERFNLAGFEERDTKVTESQYYSQEAQKAVRKLLGDNKLTMPFGTEFTKDKWRGIKGDTVRSVGAVYAIDRWNDQLEACIYLPVNMNESLSAVVKAYMTKRKGKLSYVTIGGSDVKDRSLFPYDYVSGMLDTGKYSRVAIVEGPRDALKLIDYDIPALAILGTNNWSDSKKSWVLGLCELNEVKPVVIMDADKVNTIKVGPGQKAQMNIVNSLASKMGANQVDQVTLWTHARKLGVDNMDPASMPKSLKHKLAGLCQH